MSVTNINICVDSAVQSEAQEIFTLLGLDMSAAINIFLRQAIQWQGIPFSFVAQEKKTPRPGCMKGKIWMADDFDAPLEDFKEYME